MGEHPATALRTKRRASIVVATDLVRDGEADAVVSAGSTGATMAAAVFRLGRIEGIDRPALPAHMVDRRPARSCCSTSAPTSTPRRRTSSSSRRWARSSPSTCCTCANPRIGLLNIGEEIEKGDAMAREAHEKLADADLNFVGNVEAHDMIAHRADVVVCDGFVGNVVIKFFEGITSFIFRALREDLQQGPIAPLALLALKPGFDRMKARFDYERYGGAPLLGVQGREHRHARPRRRRG